MSDHQDQRHHFHVPAREMLLEHPERCLFLPNLTLDGVAVTEAGHHHLILTLGDLDRIYFGPDSLTVSRRAEILISALQRGAAQIDHAQADLVRVWILLAWEAALDELTEALAGDLEHL